MFPHGVMFHHFYNSDHPMGQGAISAQEFENIILYLGVDRFLSPEEWSKRAINGKLKQTDLCLTFDDALLCQYDIALPILKKFKLTAFWFVYSSVLKGNVENLEIYRYFRTIQFKEIDEFYDLFLKKALHFFGGIISEPLKNFNPNQYLKSSPYYTNNDRIFRFIRDDILSPLKYHYIMNKILKQCNFDKNKFKKKLWMNEKHIKELNSCGHNIGLHSYTHPTRIDKLSKKSQEIEYTKNFNHLKILLKSNPISMSHPCNAYSNKTLNILEQLGIKIGFCDNMSEIKEKSLLLMPRENHSNLLSLVSK